MSAPRAPWWEELAPGDTVTLAFIELAAGTGGPAIGFATPDLTDPHRHARYVAGVEQLGRDFGAAQPLQWRADGVRLVLPARDEADLVQAWRAARALWERQIAELRQPTRFALHAVPDVAWEPDSTLTGAASDACAHLAQAAPDNTLVVSEDIYLALPDSVRRDLGWLGLHAYDGLATYIFPAEGATRHNGKAFVNEVPGRLWQSFRGYASLTERHLRYAGLKLTKKEPPSLDVLRVFVPPHMALRMRAVEWPRPPDDDDASADRADIESRDTAQHRLGGVPRSVERLTVASNPARVPGFLGEGDHRHGEESHEGP